MYRVDAEMRELLEGGTAVILGTADAGGKPHVLYAWGPRFAGDGASLTLFIDAGRSERTLANVGENPQMAVTFALPTTYRSVQLKGRFLQTCAATTEDEARVQDHREAFTSQVSLVGDSPEAARKRWMKDVLRIDMAIETAFDQTPGPNAGNPL